jgi:peptide/nickel transport system permease protein
VSLTPGDAVGQLLGTEGTSEAVERLRSQLGLDLPLYEQYWNWVSHAVQGDFGTSIISSESVSHVIGQRLPVTATLIIGSLLLIAVFGVGSGVFSAVRGGAAGRAVDQLSLVGFILPSFWLAAILVQLFAVNLHLFPAVGYVPFAESPSGWLESITLPILALALHGMATLARQTREAMLDVLASEHVRMAWANGIPARSIRLRYALKSAGTRIVTILGLQTVGLLGATVFVENVFALPGLGSLAVSSTVQGDLPMVLGVAVCFTVIVVVVNMIVDLLYTWLDPRVRTS